MAVCGRAGGEWRGPGGWVQFAVPLACPALPCLQPWGLAHFFSMFPHLPHHTTLPPPSPPPSPPQRREDAERALEALDGVELHDMALTIGWGKSVQLPAVPCWPPPGGLAAAREGGAAVPPPVAAQGGRRAPPCGRFGGGRTGARKEEVVGVGPDIDVSIPGDARQRFIIDALACYVMRDGCEFEQVRWGGRVAVGGVLWWYSGGCC